MCDGAGLREGMSWVLGVPDGRCLVFDRDDVAGQGYDARGACTSGSVNEMIVPGPSRG
jgi:hypothetical protein